MSSTVKTVLVVGVVLVAAWFFLGGGAAAVKRQTAPPRQTQPNGAVDAVIGRAVSAGSTYLGNQIADWLSPSGSSTADSLAMDRNDAAAMDASEGDGVVFSDDGF